jgi:hypothetical protein
MAARAVRIKAAPGESRNRMLTEIGHPPQLHAHRRALGRSLDGGDERRLAGCAVPVLAAGALTAQIGIIDPTRPISCLLESRSIINWASLCFIFHAVFCRTPRRRHSSMLEMLILLWSSCYMARNNKRMGTRVEAKWCPRSEMSGGGRHCTGTAAALSSMFSRDYFTGTRGRATCWATWEFSGIRLVL